MGDASRDGASMEGASMDGAPTDDASTDDASPADAQPDASHSSVPDAGPDAEHAEAGLECAAGASILPARRGRDVYGRRGLVVARVVHAGRVPGRSLRGRLHPGQHPVQRQRHADLRGRRPVGLGHGMRQPDLPRGTMPGRVRSRSVAVQRRRPADVRRVERSLDQRDGEGGTVRRGLRAWRAAMLGQWSRGLRRQRSVDDFDRMYTPDVRRGGMHRGVRAVRQGMLWQRGRLVRGHRAVEQRGRVHQPDLPERRVLGRVRPRADAVQRGRAAVVQRLRRSVGERRGHGWPVRRRVHPGRHEVRGQRTRDVRRLRAVGRRDGLQPRLCGRPDRSEQLRRVWSRLPGWDVLGRGLPAGHAGLQQ